MISLHLPGAGVSPALSLRPSTHRLRRQFLLPRCRVHDNSGGGVESSGEETPESLFMRELRRRGISPAPTSLLEAEEEEGGGGGRAREGKRNGVASAEYEKGLPSQRERSMALNSEGLEGLIPRAKLLLTIGGTFVLGFWPLMAVTAALFAALYFYFGPSFVHDANKMSLSPPPYIDPYALLEDKTLSPVAPNMD